MSALTQTALRTLLASTALVASLFISAKIASPSRSKADAKDDRLTDVTSD